LQSNTRSTHYKSRRMVEGDEAGLFDILALYEALDDRRRASNLSWAAVARSIGGISASTLTGLRQRRVVEGDGVLQMLRWLNRAPESFLRRPRSTPTEHLPGVAPGEVLRFDARAIYAALDTRRAANQWTWSQLAAAIGGVSASMLTHLDRGGRVSMPSIMRVVVWLGQPTASFTRASKQ
jgi:uncharacterized protein YfiM (DUF2279 family)